MPASYRNCSSAPSAGRITTGRRDQASETGKLEACEPLRAYSFLDIGDGVDLQELINLLEAAEVGAPAPD
jgi:hypothetical protein